MGAFIDLTGQTFSRLTAIERAEVDKSGGYRWKCACECGNLTLVRASSLRNGNSKSCGCLATESKKLRPVTHGKCYSPEYAAWQGMQRRCNTEPHYRDRGIRVCPRWLESFENFYSDMGDKPSPKHSIDRIDNDGNYSPENCRWATRKQQDNNRTDTVLLTLDGVTKSVSEWAKTLGVSKSTISYRKKQGWQDREALLTPALTSMLTLNGITKPIARWSEDLGINPRTLEKRKSRGWTDFEILTTPIGEKRRKSN